MSSSFVSLYATELEPSNTDDRPFATLLNRDAIFKKLGARTSLDVLVIGGGGVGALVARDAALRGLRVLVVERGFFGDRAERWRGRFSLAVRSEVARMLGSALRIRSLSRRILGDLTEITPTDPGLKLGRCRSMAVGILGRFWGASSPARGALGVPDLDERILTRELILAARQEGAFVLSNAEAAFVERVADNGSFRIGVRDLLTDELQEVTVKAVVVTPAQGSPVVTRLGTPLLPNQNQETPVVISVCAVNPRSIRSGEPLLSLELSDGSLAVIEKIAEGLVEVSLHFAGVVPEEGDLSERRAAVVSRTALAEVALRIGIDEVLMLGEGEASRGGARRPAALAAAFEALIGAIYLSHGFAAAATFIEGHMSAELAAPRAALGKGIKTLLQEWTQARNGSLPRYDVVATTGPEHDRTYECVVRIDGSEVARGSGPSRRAAEAAAAEAAIDLLGITAGGAE